MSNNPSVAQEPNESQAPLIQAGSEGEAEDLYNRLTGNLLAPLEFTEETIGLFLSRKCCAVCLGHLESKHKRGERPYRIWTAFCPRCQHDIIDGNHITAWEAERIRSGRAEGAHELSTERMKSKPRRNPADIIKELYGE